MTENKIEKLKKNAEDVISKNSINFYHCSESTFIAINDTLKLVAPEFVRIITGFHGGGGNHRLDKSINLTEALENVLCGKDTRTREELPFTGTGSMCGALAAGVACLGLVYGRESSKDDLTCIDELAYEFHKRFKDEFEFKECSNLYEGETKCAKIMNFAAKTTIEMIVNADETAVECLKSAKINFNEIE